MTSRTKPSNRGVDSIVDAMDDPERVRELLQEGEYERALEHIDIDNDDAETQFQILHGLANKIVNTDPELKRELADELPNADPSMSKRELTKDSNTQVIETTLNTSSQLISTTFFFGKPANKTILMPKHMADTQPEKSLKSTLKD